MGLNRDCIGKEYPPFPYTVGAEATKAYAAAYNQTNAWYLDDRRPGGIVACPMFGMVYTWDAALAPVFDPSVGVNFLRLVRGGVDIRLFAPVRPGDVIATRARIASIEEKSSGEVLTVETTSLNQRGERVSIIGNSHFIRGERKGEKKAEPAAEPPARGSEVLRAQMTVKPDQSFVYAKASKDENPIHTDDNVAKLAGFPGVILQGSCTMAFASGHVVDVLCGGDPTRLRRIAVRFAKPVFPGDVLTTVGWLDSESAGEKKVSFETTNQNGVTVLSAGLAEIRPAAG